MEIKVKKIDKEALLPVYANIDDAGADLFCAKETVVLAGKRGLVPTGISMEIQEGYVGLIWDKSGLAVKSGITTIAGVIDASYRGEIMVAVFNLSDEPHTFSVGNKIAQILIQPIIKGNFVEADILSNTERNDKGFGSTGK